MKFQAAQTLLLNVFLRLSSSRTCTDRRRLSFLHSLPLADKLAQLFTVVLKNVSLAERRQSLIGMWSDCLSVTSAKGTCHSYASP